MKHARDIQEENKELITEKRTEEVQVVERQQIDDYIDVPPSFQEMLPIARKMIKDQVKKELNEYLRMKQNLDLENNAPDR